MKYVTEVTEFWLGYEIEYESDVPEYPGVSPRNILIRVDYNRCYHFYYPTNSAILLVYETEGLKPFVDNNGCTVIAAS